jgi:hypothetical protein
MGFEPTAQYLGIIGPSRAVYFINRRLYLKSTGFYLDSFAQMCPHVVSFVRMQIQISCNLLRREIQAMKYRHNTRVHNDE